MRERGQDGAEFNEETVKQFIAPDNDDYNPVVPPPLPIPLWMVSTLGLFVCSIFGCMIWCIVVLVKKLFFQEKDMTAEDFENDAHQRWLENGGDIDAQVDEYDEEEDDNIVFSDAEYGGLGEKPQ